MQHAAHRVVTATAAMVAVADGTGGARRRRCPRARHGAAAGSTDLRLRVAATMKAGARRPCRTDGAGRRRRRRCSRAVDTMTATTATTATTASIDTIDTIGTRRTARRRCRRVTISRPRPRPEAPTATTARPRLEAPTATTVRLGPAAADTTTTTRRLAAPGATTCPCRHLVRKAKHASFDDARLSCATHLTEIPRLPGAEARPPEPCGSCGTSIRIAQTQQPAASTHIFL